MRTLAHFAALSALALSGCSGGGEKTKATSSSGEISGDLDVAAFQGGYGIDFYEAAAKEFEGQHPGLKVRVEGNPRIWEQLRPRFIGGNPPDLCYPGWGMDHWALAEEGQLVALDDALAGGPHEGEGTWGEAFEPSILALGKLEGKQYVLPHFFNVFGWWYDPRLFTKNGWTPPRTYEELLSLCAKIKARGISPITYQGKYPYYMVEGMLLPWAMSAGGAEAVRAAQNLEPGAWKSPAMIQAARMIVQLRDRGFFQPGATALSHTESQQEFLQGEAAMIPCGTWLHSEMKNVMPAGAKMEFMLPPVLATGKGEPTNVLIGIEPWMIPSDAKNPKAAVAFFKFMTSLEKAKQFVEEKGTLVAIKGGDQAKLPAVLVKPAEAFKSSKLVWAVQFRQWYPAFDTEVQNALTAMLNGEVSPEAFCDRVEAAAEKTRNDPNIAKHKVGA